MRILKSSFMNPTIGSRDLLKMQVQRRLAKPTTLHSFGFSLKTGGDYWQRLEKCSFRLMKGISWALSQTHTRGSGGNKPSSVAYCSMHKQYLLCLAAAAYLPVIALKPGPRENRRCTTFVKSTRLASPVDGWTNFCESNRVYVKRARAALSLRAVPCALLPYAACRRLFARSLSPFLSRLHVSLSMSGETTHHQF